MSCECFSCSCSATTRASALVVRSTCVLSCVFTSAVLSLTSFSWSATASAAASFARDASRNPCTVHTHAIPRPPTPKRTHKHAHTHTSTDKPTYTCNKHPFVRRHAYTHIQRLWGRPPVQQQPTVHHNKGGGARGGRFFLDSRIVCVVHRITVRQAPAPARASDVPSPTAHPAPSSRALALLGSTGPVCIPTHTSVLRYNTPCYDEDTHPVNCPGHPHPTHIQSPRIIAQLLPWRRINNARSHAYTSVNRDGYSHQFVAKQLLFMCARSYTSVVVKHKDTVLCFIILSQLNLPSLIGPGT